MQVTPLIETAIAIILVFFIFSLLSSFILELFAESANLRGKLLKRMMIDLFADPTGRMPNMAHLIYDHPLISAMVYRKNRLPERVAGEQFADALNAVFRELTNSGLLSVTKMDDSDSVDEFRYELKTADKARITNSGIRNSDLRFLYQAAYSTNIGPERNWDLESENYKKVFVQWFDKFNEQLKIVYKRRTRFRLFIIGLILALSFRCDAIYLIQRLYGDVALRTEMVGAAERIGQMDSTQNAGTILLDSIMITDIMQAKGITTPYSALNKEEKAKLLYDHLHSLPITREVESYRNLTAGQWIAMIAGILITAVSVIFGAPFWYDALRRLISVKDTLKKSQS